MKIHKISLDACPLATGLVVVVDVIRAFSTAAYAFGHGVSEILLVGTVEEAFVLRQRFPGYRLMGEVAALPVAGFDYCNSPSEIIADDLRGCGLIHRTSAGTQGVVRSEKADSLLATSFTVASATARRIRELAPESVSFVITGWDAGFQYNGPKGDGSGFGDEDLACADYIERLLMGDRPDPQPYLQRVIQSAAGKLFTDPSRPEFPEADLGLCIAIDRFDYALQVERRDGLFVLNPI